MSRDERRAASKNGNIFGLRAAKERDEPEPPEELSTSRTHTLLETFRPSQCASECSPKRRFELMPLGSHQLRAGGA